jgi:RNase P subunit RPR2
MSLQQQSFPDMKMTTACLECGSLMSISAVAPTMVGNVYEDITYRCRKCGNIQRCTIDTRE